MCTIKESVVAYAREIGLDLVGVTTAEPFTRYLDELERRDEHYQPRYGYRVESWKRFATPRAAMPDAKSVVVMGFYYLTDEVPSSEPCGKIGRIVTYGHLGILKRARLMRSFLQEAGYKALMGGHRKEAAMRAGLGMVGKHNLVMNREYGSWVAYQSIITNAEMEPDEPFTEDLCGDCEQCLEACPTSALFEPRRLDPRKCVTCLLTSANVDEEHLPSMGTYILGCDVCLEACPKNAGLTTKAEVESLLPDGIGTQPPLRQLLGFTEDTFQDGLISFIHGKISDRPLLGALLRNKVTRRVVTWLMKTLLKGKETLPETFVHASSKLMVYKRNAIIAAGNLGDPSMLGAIEPYVDDAQLGPYAQWSIERLRA
jgi:epoxyqueuosine reductase